MPGYIAALFLLPFPLLLAAAALKDLTSFTIPNKIPLALLATFPVAALACGLPLATVAQHGAVGLAALVAGMGLFAFRIIGGGDAKLLAAVALWLGWPALSSFLIVTVLAGGALSLGLITLRRAQFRHLVLAGPPWVAKLAEPGEGAPYGVAIAVGAMAAFLSSPFATVLPLP
jgi:prepilin peptidase CpaA